MRLALAILVVVSCSGDRTVTPGASHTAPSPLPIDASVPVVSTAVAPPDAGPLDAPDPELLAEAAWRNTSPVVFDPLEIFDHSRTRQRWIVHGRGEWQLQSWALLEPSPARTSGTHRFDPSQLEGPRAWPHDGVSRACPPDMVAVAGDMLAEGDEELIAAQDGVCNSWFRQDGSTEPSCRDNAFRVQHPDRCDCYHEEFRRTHYAACICEEIDEPRYRAHVNAFSSRRRTMAPYCVDRYEFPNHPGEYPVVSVTWTDAQRACTRAGRRLCTEWEWTFACEGPDALPYPTGFALDPARCNVARPMTPYVVPALEPTHPAFGGAIARVWQGLPSGAEGECRSPFGVFDMAGNVDEWTRSSGRVDEAEHRWVSILKGGYWGERLNRCRVSTRAHYQAFSYYQMGFRCCATPSP